MVEPVEVERDREPNRWGAGGPGIPGNGTIHASGLAKADLEAGGLAVGELRVESATRSESDEGDYDSYYSHELLYKGERVWSLGTSSHCNIGGAWGTSSRCRVVGNDLVVDLTHEGRTVGGGHDSHEQRKYSVMDVLIAAAVRAGADSSDKSRVIFISSRGEAVVGSNLAGGELFCSSCGEEVKTVSRLRDLVLESLSLPVDSAESLKIMSGDQCMHLDGAIDDLNNIIVIQSLLPTRSHGAPSSD